MTGDLRKQLDKCWALVASDQDHEAVAALRVARKLAAQMGFASLELAIASSTNQALDEKRIAAIEAEALARGREQGIAEAAGTKQFPCWLAALEHILAETPHYLSSWEHGFATSYLEARWGSPSPKQAAILQRIADKCGVTVI